MGVRPIFCLGASPQFSKFLNFRGGALLRKYYAFGRIFGIPVVCDPASDSEEKLL